MELLVKEYRGTKDRPTAIADLHHVGHIVVVDDVGKQLWKIGNPERVTFSRSSAKPIQTIPILESGAIEKFEITDEELAVMCSSHRGEQCHVDAVRSILMKAGLNEGHLRCGGHGGQFASAGYIGNFFGEKDKDYKTVFAHNCSGKHAGMLLTAKKLGYGLSDYYKKEHLIQQRIIETIAEVCDFPMDEIGIGIDGCGVPVHAMPLYKFAQGYARMSNPKVLGQARQKYAEKITKVMTEHPHMVGGRNHNDFTTELMQEFGDKLFCKFGANGFFAIGIKGKGIGIAIKMEDGLEKNIPIVVLETLRQIGELTDEEVTSAESLNSVKSCIEINDSMGNTVGRRVPHFSLKT